MKGKRRPQHSSISARNKKYDYAHAGEGQHEEGGEILSGSQLPVSRLDVFIDLVQFCRKFISPAFDQVYVLRVEQSAELFLGAEEIFFIGIHIDAFSFQFLQPLFDPRKFFLGQEKRLLHDFRTFVGMALRA